MDKRVAIMAIIVQNRESAESVNALLHEQGDYIIGRLGLPYKEKNVNIISIALDAPQDVINTLAGKIGELDGVSAKTLFSPI